MRIGIDLGGTKTEIVALGDGGRELFRKRTDTPAASYDAIVATLAGLVNEAESALDQRGTVGVGIPGTISARTGLVKNANTTALNGRPLDRDLGRALARDVRCQNDANCLALSEAVDGAGAGRRVVFAAILGTGCGAGIASTAGRGPAPTSSPANGATIRCLGRLPTNFPARHAGAAKPPASKNGSPAPGSPTITPAPRASASKASRSSPAPAKAKPRRAAPWNATPIASPVPSPTSSTCWTPT